MYNHIVDSNYKNIIPYNLKKKKNRVHGDLIAVKKLQFKYSFLELNGLKTDNRLLANYFFNLNSYRPFFVHKYRYFRPYKK